MKRITPEMVIDAYIATGMYPIFGHFNNGNGGGCAVEAIACSKNNGRGTLDMGVDQIGPFVGVDYDYLWDFLFGFDGRDGAEIGKPEIAHSQAYQDGMAARAAVKAHFARAKKQAPSQPIHAESTETAACCV
jgi:hypothetical protein